MPVTPGLWMQVHDLIETYGRLLDEDRLEAWVELFAENCRYEIISRENRAQNLPLSLMLCENKDMLCDRIYSLRQANIYNIHSDCHIIGLVSATQAPSAPIAATAPYSLFQSNQEGDSRLFSVGRYYLDIVEQDHGLRISRQIVVVDTGSIPTLLATPI
jgi:anthranilate 1,2-dioxygenase small subunit